MNFFEELKKYFDNTPNDEIIKQWEKTKELDEIGPKIDHFMQETQNYYKFKISPNIKKGNYLTEKINPEFSSGFSFI